MKTEPSKTIPFNANLGDCYVWQEREGERARYFVLHKGVDAPDETFVFDTLTDAMKAVGMLRDKKR